MMVEAMGEVDIDISQNTPKGLTLEMVEKVNKMITMGCGADAEAVCPTSFIETENWALEDPAGKPRDQVRKIRDEIKNRVIKLIEEMSADSK